MSLASAHQPSLRYCLQPTVPYEELYYTIPIVLAVIRVPNTRRPAHMLKMRGDCTASMLQSTLRLRYTIMDQDDQDALRGEPSDLKAPIRS